VRADEKLWLELFVHLARGDWAQAGPVAQALLQSAPVGSALQRKLLVQTASTALTLAGDGAAARKLLEAQTPSLPEADRGSVWLRLLFAHALRAGGAQAAARAPTAASAASR
jgi:hypothetical protein